MSLTHEEKDELYGVIEIMFGYDSQLESLKPNYTEETVEVVETALEALIKCNDNMKELVVGLLGGARYLAKGWLKKILGNLKKRLDSEKIKFNGIGCRNVSLYNWKSAIVISAY